MLKIKTSDEKDEKMRRRTVITLTSRATFPLAAGSASVTALQRQRAVVGKGNRKWMRFLQDQLTAGQDM